MGTTTRHHFIPRRYLEGFCQDGFLSAYEGEKGEYRRPTPKNTSLQTDFYSLEDEHGNNDATNWRLSAPSTDRSTRQLSLPKRQGVGYGVIGSSGAAQVTPSPSQMACLG